MLKYKYKENEYEVMEDFFSNLEDKIQELNDKRLYHIEKGSPLRDQDYTPIRDNLYIAEAVNQEIDTFKTRYGIKVKTSIGGDALDPVFAKLWKDYYTCKILGSNPKKPDITKYEKKIVFHDEEKIAEEDKEKLNYNKDKENCDKVILKENGEIVKKTEKREENNSKVQINTDVKNMNLEQIIKNLDKERVGSDGVSRRAVLEIMSFLAREKMSLIMFGDKKILKNLFDYLNISYYTKNKRICASHDQNKLENIRKNLKETNETYQKSVYIGLFLNYPKPSIRSRIYNDHTMIDYYKMAYEMVKENLLTPTEALTLLNFHYYIPALTESEIHNALINFRKHKEIQHQIAKKVPYHYKLIAQQAQPFSKLATEQEFY